jgi:hypothetical protein
MVRAILFDLVQSSRRANKASDVSMKYKVIKSAAHNFARSFASGLNWAESDYVMSHLLRAAIATRTERCNRQPGTETS